MTVNLNVTTIGDKMKKQIQPHRYERLLADMLNEVHRRGLKGTTRAMYRDAKGESTFRENAVSCCAVGALNLVHRTNEVRDIGAVTVGNDILAHWCPHYPDSEEELGNAFRDAMEMS